MPEARGRATGGLIIRLKLAWLYALGHNPKAFAQVCRLFRTKIPI